MAERITLNGLYRQFVDFRGEFNLLAQNYAEHMRQEQPWMDKVDAALFGVDGDEDKPGLHRDVAEIKGYVKSGWGLFKWAMGTVISAALIIGVSSLVGCIQREVALSNLPEPQQTAIALNSTYAAGTATANSVFAPTPEYDPTQTPTPTETPRATDTPSPTPTSSILEVTPCGAYICETTDNQTDIDILARLCVVEVRGFGSIRDDACASIVSTVLMRAYNRYLSDGTVRGTILWNCTQDNCQQFPGYVVNGCEGILPVACPWNYPEDIVHFRDVVDHYIRGHWGPGFWCSGYAFYDSRQTSITPDACYSNKKGCNLLTAKACVIVGDDGQMEVFHD